MTVMIASSAAPIRYQGEPNAESARLIIAPPVLMVAHRFSSSNAAARGLWLQRVAVSAVRNLQDYRGPNVGTRSAGWKQALQAFTIYFEGRIPAP